MKHTSSDDFIQLLIDGKSYDRTPDSLKLFAQFIESWDWSGFDYQEDAVKMPTKGHCR